ncbi:DegT/DnrJ/EryC1/StrS family aminotransferase [Paenibacillus radicis (ex Xue et al. 2023)]|uniref:DegT/DnrJ/EryC1/StrS family aminotransferase n=1 Tax=Paenibacillus radicis (ex Xue et al. 2023) TaxID=2972489 RepID=A0ABT1YGS1_9BACL|nr:DegT/DnrJ/EryC1/StrS family aminotransferase [Paenibacillus radicis (ex Xue et al. 2023)]MCR8632376.1 DegT/DnrJ/EryC1/StrS family aminotransferase [Paenibacillus radicis (ex Xue et al. 2023)]
MSELALFGGKPIRNRPHPWVNTMGEEEINAVNGVMKSGIVSAFLGRSGEGFLGGPKVQEIENCFSTKFGTEFAISVNSATSALHTAVAACEIGPGDEVLVTPYSMVATASAILMNGAVPIFVDIDEHTYNLNPKEIEKWITPRTKGIIVTNLFGLAAMMDEIISIARKHNLYVIEDNAQAPGAKINNRYSGTVGDIGVFSLNYHKIIHSGEGGILLTRDEKLARRCRLHRNHGEMVVDDEKDYETITLGNNYRMSELHAAIGIEQLKKLDHLLNLRRILGEQITSGLQLFEGLKGVHIPQGFEHTYYAYPIQFIHQVWGISRKTFSDAMNAEGFPLGTGYQKPIYLLPMYQHKKVFNHTNYPFSLIEKPVQQYERGICAVTEKMYFETLLIADLCRLPYESYDIETFIEAIQKVWNERGRLAHYERNYTPMP